MLLAVGAWAACSPGEALRINELMPRNATTVQDNVGEHDDWVELFNGSDEALDLVGFMLSDDESEPDKLVFGEETLVGANGYLLVFLDDTPAQSTPDEPHGGFKLSGDGEVVVLSDPSGVPLDLVVFPALAEDVSFGRAPDGTGDFVALESPTPGAANATPAEGEGEGCESAFDQPPPVFVNEVLVENATGLTDGTGPTPWIELYNAGATAQSLAGLVLGNDEALTTPSPLEGHTIPAGGFLVLFADGNPEEGVNHTVFALTAETSVVVLADICTGTAFHSLSLGVPVVDISFGLFPDGFVDDFSLVPTPGGANIID